MSSSSYAQVRDDNMAAKLALLLICFLAIQSTTLAGIFPPDEILELIESSDIWDFEIFDEIAEEFFEVFPENEPFARNPQKCLQYVQEAYDTAVEVRRIINQGKLLAKKLKGAIKKCKSVSNPEDKKKCFGAVKKQAQAEGKPLKDAYKKVKPKVVEIMGKFDTCMA